MQAFYKRFSVIAGFFALLIVLLANAFIPDGNSAYAGRKPGLGVTHATGSCELNQTDCC